MIILYSLLMVLIPIALGLLLWQCFRADKLLKEQRELRLVQLRQFSRQLRAQRQEIEQLHRDVAHMQLPLPSGQTWWVLNAIFKAFKVRQLRNMAMFNTPHAGPKPTGLLHS